MAERQLVRCRGEIRRPTAAHRSAGQPRSRRRWNEARADGDELSITKFGTHTGRRRHPDVPPEELSNGTKLAGAEAKAGSNFLTPRIFEIAKARVAAKQEHETSDQTRLFRDLLSSMPMAFNLFWEASLPVHEVSRPRLAEVLETPLRQIWRDHLLALSMRQHPDQWTDLTCYRLLYPSRNVSFRDAAGEYEKLLVEGDTSFRAVRIDDIVDAAFAHGGATKERFTRRYLWWINGA